METTITPRGKTREINVSGKEGIDVEALTTFFDEMKTNAIKSNAGNKAAGRRLRVNLSEFKHVAKQLRQISA